MSSMASAEKPKTGRSATSCLECQRRKQKCSREWPCNHCQARKVPHLCQFASKKPPTPEDELSATPAKLGKRRLDKEDSFETVEATLEDDSDHGLSDGLAKLGYMPGHDFFSLTNDSLDSNGRSKALSPAQSEEVEVALKAILPKPYTDVLVQNYLERANYQYYPIFPEQLRDQSAKWWEARAAGERLSPELTCLIIRVCAVSVQYLEDSLRQRLEFELGEKAQSMTVRFHSVAQKLSSSIPRGQGGILQVQQLFLEATWWKSEASMVESWHALSGAIREAQEIGMHKAAEGLPNFERELRKRLWCILWTWDWQMSTLLSRPLLIDQDDHEIQIPDGRLENMADPDAPHPLSAVALQAELGLYVSHLFQKLGSDSSVKLTLEIEDALEKWMGTFPAALRDHRPDTRWDQKYPNIPFMRCQLNVIAYCYLLGPLKPYLLGTADPEIMSTKLGQDLRVKGVDTCLDLMNASEKFYDLIFPASIKYFFIIFFMFDAATVMCSAIVHDADRTLPKRGQCIRALRTAQELMDGVAHLSESARISSQLLRKLTATTLPLTAAEKQTLGVGLNSGSSPPSSSANKKARIGSDASSSAGGGSSGIPAGVVGGASKSNSSIGERYDWSAHQTFGAGGVAPMTTTDASSVRTTTAMPPYDLQHQQQPPSYAVATAGQPLYHPHHPGASAIHMPPPGTTATGATTATTTTTLPMQWPVMDYGTSSGIPGQQQQHHPPTSTIASSIPPVGGVGGGLVVHPVSMQPGDPLTGTFLEPLWDWEHLNMDLSAYNNSMHHHHHHYDGL